MKMLTKRAVEKSGYKVLPDGAWLRIAPEDFPHEWVELSEKFRFDPNAESVILCICGVKEKGVATKQ
jgi:hypothetical protein